MKLLNQLKKNIADKDLLTEKPSKVFTTEEELEGFMIVKTILRQKISPNRVSHRDAAQSYFAILLDDSNRKPICRLYLNSSKNILQRSMTRKRNTK